jgi:hypothetical protein
MMKRFGLLIKIIQIQLKLIYFFIDWTMTLQKLLVQSTIIEANLK